jgi:hypothetical protein
MRSVKRDCSDGRISLRLADRGSFFRAFEIKDCSNHRLETTEYGCDHHDEETRVRIVLLLLLLLDKLHLYSIGILAGSLSEPFKALSADAEIPEFFCASVIKRH